MKILSILLFALYLSVNATAQDTEEQTKAILVKQMESAVAQQGIDESNRLYPFQRQKYHTDFAEDYPKLNEENRKFFKVLRNTVNDLSLARDVRLYIVYDTVTVSIASFLYSPEGQLEIRVSRNFLVKNFQQSWLLRAVIAHEYSHDRLDHLRRAWIAENCKDPAMALKMIWDIEARTDQDSAVLLFSMGFDPREALRALELIFSQHRAGYSQIKYRTEKLESYLKDMEKH